jgi:quercetin dioxygenase-like cupin family protein
MTEIQQIIDGVTQVIETAEGDVVRFRAGDWHNLVAIANPATAQTVAVDAVPQGVESPAPESTNPVAQG